MNFKEKVVQAVKMIPKGRVVSYGQVALACGSPRAARQVGWVLHTLDGGNSVPWWRVINNLGLISIKGNLISTPQVQKQFLEQEKIIVSDDYKIDINKYRYNYFSASGLKKKMKNLVKEMIKKILIFGILFLGLLFVADVGLVWGMAHIRPDIKDADAIIVLGAAINTPALKNRTLKGLELYEDGKSDLMVLSGGKIADSDISEAEFMAKVIDQNQEAPVKYVLEDQSHNTYENLKNSKAELDIKKPGADSVIIVSDAFHLARAVLLAKRIGFETVYWQAPSSGYYQRPELRFYYVREFFAMLSYIPKFISG